MKSVPVPGFGGPTYNAISGVMNCERSVNLYPEKGAEYSKSPSSLVGRPGLALFMTLPNSTARGLWAGNNRLFAVGGNHFYELTSGGTVLTDYGAMGGGSLEQVQIVANGDQLLVMNDGNQIYNANPVGPSMDPVFVGSALEYLDGFYIAIDAAADNKMNVSNFLDGTVWDVLDTVQRTGSADKLVQLAVLNSQLWLFGERTIEIWYNAGGSLFPFARMPGATINYGLVAKFSVVKFSDTILWLGQDANGFVDVYMANGITPVRVSNPAISNQIAGITAANPAGRLSSLTYTTAFGYQENGHIFYVLNLKTSHSVTVATFVYDLVEKQWHERAYTGGWPNCYANVPGVAFNATGPAYVGDAKTGNIYYQGQGYTGDAGTDIVYTRTFPHVADRNHQIKFPLLELDAQLGTAAVGLEWSNDGGTTFPFTRTPIVGSAETSQGQAPRFRWWQLGSSRDRVFRMTITDKNNLIRLVNCYVGVGASEEP